MEKCGIIFIADFLRLAKVKISEVGDKPHQKPKQA